MRRVVVAVVAALSAVVPGLVSACQDDAPVELWVDGFAPDDVRFEVESFGLQTAEQLATLRRRPDIDGSLLLPAGSCGGPCRAAVVTVFINNRKPDPEPPPVIRLDAPVGKPRRLPIAFRDAQIERGAIGRIRWLVELWPEERLLSATLSSSVRLEINATPAPTSASTPP
jgi:hypothetical protein